MTARAWVVLAVLIGGCGRSMVHGPPIPPTDAGRTDAGRTDAGRTDSGRPDAGVECSRFDDEELACLAVGCVPIYDDSCCPLCEPTGMCADCSRLEIWRCVDIATACADDPPAVCGSAAPWFCGGSPNCFTARPTSGDRCSVPGCVAAKTAGCGVVDCPTICRPIAATSCMWSCEMEPPECSMGFVPEGDGSCFTGWCIAASVCAPPTG